MSLATKYRPQEFSDVSEQKTVVNIISNICSQDDLENRNFLFIGPAGTGKAQPLYSKVLTTKGFVKMKDIKLGQFVVTHKGNVGQVVGIYPQGRRAIYRITLEDGAYIDVADNHLNLVQDTWFNNTECVLTTDYLIYAAELHRYAIPVANLDDWVDRLNVYDPCRESESRKIEKITYLSHQECQCIFIDHKDHTYISDNFIPTHNTTIARIMANILNDGNDNSTIEIDAASHNGVDSVREIISQARLYPVGTRWKVFVIDEVHSFSQQAWQIFLKPLEDAPAKSIFIFCTTNPEKIPATIISRVQTFQLSKISLEGIYNRLVHIIEQENREGANITYTEDAVNYIAKLANGGMRDSITKLDQVLAFTHDLTSESVAKALNLPEYDDYFKLLGAYSKRNNAVVSQVINDVYDSGVNFVKWFEGFHSFVMNVVKYIFLQDINLTMIPSHYQEKISKYGTAHSIVCLKLANKLLKLNYELKTTQYLQEVALTHLCQLPKKGEK